MRYIIKVLPTEECNPDFAPDGEMTEGIEADGFALIGFKNEKPLFESMMGVTVKQLSDWIVKREKGAQVMRQACAIAEGEIRAEEISEEKGDRGTVIGSLNCDTKELTKELIRKILTGRD